MRRSRRGSNAIEQALLTPALMVMLIGGFEYGWTFFRVHQYGWTFFRVHQIEAFARQAGRIAAATPLDDDPAAVFESEFEALMDGAGMGTEGLLITAEVDGDAPARTLEVEVTLEWGGLTGLIPVPDNLTVDYSTWLEDQSRSI